MAQDLNTSKTFLLTEAIKEAGWTKDALDHNQTLNNPFGVNKINSKGKASGNVAYSSLDAAIDYWKGQFGDQVRGTQTAQDFINGLEYPPPGGHRVNPYPDKYVPAYLQDYSTMVKFMKLCGIQ